MLPKGRRKAAPGASAAARPEGSKPRGAARRSAAQPATRPATRPATAARLAALRRMMDVLNLRLLELVERRAKLARGIGRTKARLGLPAVDPTRESEMLAAVLDAASGELPRREVERVFRAVLRASREGVLRDRRRRS